MGWGGGGDDGRWREGESKREGSERIEWRVERKSREARESTRCCGCAGACGCARADT